MENKKLQFEEPIVELVLFENEDIIMTSPQSEDPAELPPQKF